MADYPFIQTPEEVEALVEKLGREKVIAVDTEADSFFHYFDKLCLVQIGAAAGTFLVDPLAMEPESLAGLKSIFANPSIRKIFHAAEYDLYVLQRHCGLQIVNLFDTMISAQLLGYPAVGLGALVERHFDIKLSKDQQRTDWSRRPLRDVQIEYAASDVRYLIELTTILEKELAAKGRLEWAREDFLSLEERVWPEREFDDQGYMRIKGAKKLTPRQLAVLRELFLMRDKRARVIDRPPFKVLGNGTLLDLAQNPARSRRTLAKRRGVTDLVMRRLGNEIVEALKAGLDGPEHPPLEKKPSGNGRRRLDRRAETRLDALKEWRKRRAKELALDPGVFCPNASLEEIAWAHPAKASDLREVRLLKGWWVKEFGAEVVAVSEGAMAPPPEPRPEKAPAAAETPEKKNSRRRRGSRGGRRKSTGKPSGSGDG